MSFIKKKISSKNMGLVVYETARIRTKSFYDYCESIELNFKPAGLQVSTFTYNFFFISRVLSKKYKPAIVNQIMSSAYDHFFYVAAQHFNQEEIAAIKKDISKTFHSIDEIMNLKNSEGFNGLIVHLSKQLLFNIVGTNEYSDDSITIMDISIELASWIQRSDFLITEYTVK